MWVKRHFGLRQKIEPAEIVAGSGYLIFVAAILVIGLAFIHP